jgi:hypothetical protein
MLSHQKRFRTAITKLLPQISTNRETAMMPHHRTWHKAQAAAPTVLAKPPANVHIITRRDKIGLETTNGMQRDFADR